MKPEEFNQDELTCFIKEVQDGLLAEGQPLRVCDRGLFRLGDLVLFALYCDKNPFAFYWFESNHRN